MLHGTHPSQGMLLEHSFVTALSFETTVLRKLGSITLLDMCHSNAVASFTGREKLCNLLTPPWGHVDSNPPPLDLIPTLNTITGCYLGVKTRHRPSFSFHFYRTPQSIVQALAATAASAGPMSPGKRRPGAGGANVSLDPAVRSVFASADGRRLLIGEAFQHQYRGVQESCLSLFAGVYI